MSISYSPISDLYGLSPQTHQIRRQGGVRLFVVIVLAGLFFYQSIRPAMHLRDDPPSGFVAVNVNPTSPQFRQQESLGRSYWQIAVQQVQEEYPFGTKLPSRPPADFLLQSENSSAMRLHYWNKLREQWDQRDSWVSAYEWNTDWIPETLESWRSTVRDYLPL